MLRFRCKTCDQKIKIEEKYAGRNIRCPQCGIVNKPSERLPAELSAPGSPSTPAGKKSATTILFKFRCKSCHQKIRIDEKYANKKVKCPRCKHVNKVTQTPPAQTPIPAHTSDPDNISIVNFTTPHRRFYGDDSEEDWENELLVFIEPDADSTPAAEEPEPAARDYPETGKLT